MSDPSAAVGTMAGMDTLRPFLRRLSASRARRTPQRPSLADPALWAWIVVVAMLIVPAAATLA